MTAYMDHKDLANEVIEQSRAREITDGVHRVLDRIAEAESVAGREAGSVHLLAATKTRDVGEILAAADFYDFDAKYYNAESKTVVNPELPGNAAEEVRNAAVRIFKAVDGFGLSRVDFFVKENGQIVFNEINTMPGFTAISMYPMLWEAAGMDKAKLVQGLIDLAMHRYDK